MKETLRALSVPVDLPDTGRFLKEESKIDMPSSPLWKPASQEMAQIQIFIMGVNVGLDKTSAPHRTFRV